ncbi:MAG TPA: trehalose-6-phosphate synthase, partial [Herpetosiphonaceae bacterium]|nr:trehalose-6-phosphate synthase [Herpetosiphonaceae bacterium]
IDGMNLVAKEGVTVNEKDGVLILSEGAGAAEQLSEHALLISPSDILGTMEALRTALEMPITERHARATALREQVAREDLSMWLAYQFHDIERLFGDGEESEVRSQKSEVRNEDSETRIQESAVGADDVEMARLN